MMNYFDFYDIATYGNEHWKGGFTEREVANNAYDYFVEYEYSVQQKEATHTIEELCNLLEEDCRNMNYECNDRLVVENWLCMIHDGID